MRLPKRTLLRDNRERYAMSHPGQRREVLKGREAGARDLQAWYVIGLRMDGRHCILDGAESRAQAARKARRFRKYCKAYIKVVVERSDHAHEGEMDKLRRASHGE